MYVNQTTRANPLGRERIIRINKRYKHHIAISAAVSLATIAHFIFPDAAFSPLAGLLASLVWVWSD